MGFNLGFKGLKYSYKFETLVPFKVLPLWLDALILVLLTLLETVSKLFNENAVKGCQQFLLNLCVSKMPPFQILLHLWGGGGRDINSILFLAKNCWMLKAVWVGALSWCKNQFPLCHFFSFSSQALTPSFQHIQVKLLIYCLSWRNKLPVHYPTNTKTRNQHCLNTWVNLPHFFWSGQIWWLPLLWLQLWRRVVPITPTLITSYNFCEKLIIIFELFL